MGSTKMYSPLLAPSGLCRAGQRRGQGRSAAVTCVRVTEVALPWPIHQATCRIPQKKSCCHGESSTWTRFLSRMCCSSRARPRQQHSFLLAGGCTQGLCEAGSKPGKSPAPVSPCQLLLGSGSGAKRGGGQGCFCSLGHHICSPSAGCVVRGSSWGAGAVVASCLPSSVT